jgi:hypothetical protein
VRSVVHHLLLTWNPGPLDEHVFTPEAWHDALVAPYLRGETVTTSWGVGRHVNNIEPGDVAFLYRQGRWGRGIVARGIIRSHPWAAPHWARPGGTTNHVDVEWQESVPVEVSLDLADLETLAPEFAWRQVYSSGRQLPAATAAKVSRDWKEHVRAVS